MQENTGRKDFEIVERCAAVCKFERDNFTLLRHPHAPADRSHRLGGNGAARRRTTTRHRAAAAVEETHRHAKLASDRHEAALRLEQFKAGAEKAAILVRVRIAQHDFLRPALCSNRRARHGCRQQVAHDGRASPQVFDGLEQRHDAQPAGFARRRVCKKSTQFGQQINAKNVIGTLRHRQDEGPDSRRIRSVQGLSHQVEEAEQFGALFAHALEARQEPHGLFKFFLEPGTPGGLARCRTSGTGQRVELLPHLLQHAIDDRAVLPEVEACRPEAEDLNLPAHRPHILAGKPAGFHLHQRQFGLLQQVFEFRDILERRGAVLT